MGARSSRNTTQNNRSDGHLLEYFRNTFVRGGGGTNFVPPPPLGLTATGGVISDYTSGPAVYRAHIFTSTGTFTVTAPGTFGDTVEYLVVAGGGGGGAGSHAGGGGAGGFRTNVSGHPLASPTAFPVSTSPGAYTVTIGAGGVGGVDYDAKGANGGPSSFGPTITSAGGGGAGSSGSAAYNAAGVDGGSGGGASWGRNGGAGIGSVVNYQILGDTDI